MHYMRVLGRTMPNLGRLGEHGDLRGNIGTCFVALDPKG